jgi:hypothetical protein
MIVCVILAGEATITWCGFPARVTTQERSYFKKRMVAYISVPFRRDMRVYMKNLAH